MKIVILLALYTYLMIGLYMGIRLSCVTAWDFASKRNCNYLESLLAGMVLGFGLTIIMEVLWLPVYIVTKEVPYKLELIK